MVGSCLPETDAAREFIKQTATSPQCSVTHGTAVLSIRRQPTPGGWNATCTACQLTHWLSGTPAPFLVAWPPSQLPHRSACHLRGQLSWEPPRHLPKYLDQTTKDMRLLRDATRDQRPHTFNEPCLDPRLRKQSLAAHQLHPTHPPGPHRCDPALSTPAAPACLPASE